MYASKDIHQIKLRKREENLVKEMKICYNPNWAKSLFKTVKISSSQNKLGDAVSKIPHLRG